MKRIFFAGIFFVLNTMCSLAQTFPVETIFKNGPDDKRINFVFLSDGYQAAEMTKYISDVNTVVTQLFNQPPFNTYKKHFNVYAVKVTSLESGASHPRNSVDSDCAAVPQATVNNYFGSSFDAFGIHRLLTTSKNVGSVLAANVPQYDQVFILVNSPHYGGSGGTYAVSSTHESSSEIAIHEIGHSFAALADEYWTGTTGESPNRTSVNNPSTVKWKNWLNTNGVGIYPYETSSSWFRPHQNCKMRYLGSSFCHVCTEAFVERIHTLTTAVESYTPSASSPIDLGEETLDFSLTMLEPEPSTLRVLWKKNNLIVGKNMHEVSIGVDDFMPGENTIRAEILDTTAHVKNSAHNTTHLEVITWTVKKNVTGLEIDSFREKYSVTLYPNPIVDHLNLSFTLSKRAEVKLIVNDMSGRSTRVMKKHFDAGTHDLQLRPSALEMDHSGVYLFTLDIDGTSLTQKLTRQ